jgi:site-specific DNA recombinase
MKRAAIYARVSTERQEREGTSLDSQVERCLNVATERGWSVERVVKEQGSGGDIDKRKELQHLLTLAKTGQIAALIVYHIDRFSRDVSDQGWLKREFRKAGVELVFATGHQDPIYQAIDGAMAQNERAQIKERIARGKQTTARGGKYLPGGGPPYGYCFRYEKDGRREKVVGLDRDPETAPILREIFTSLADGVTATGICRRLNDRGVRSPRGGRWCHSTVCAIVKNTVYEGRPYALRFRSIYDPITHTTRIEPQPVEDQVPLPAGVAPALVSHELFARANVQLTAGKIGSRRSNPEPERYLLRAGFVRCGSCGGAISSSRLRGEPAYQCTQRHQRGCLHEATIRAHELDRVVWDMVTMVLKDPAWIRQQLEEQANDPSLTERITEHQISLKKLRQEERKLAAQLGVLDDSTPVIMRLKEVSASRKIVESELDDLLFQQQHTQQITQSLNGFDQRLLDAYERVDEMGYEERRAILRQFNVQVTLWQKSHDPRYTIDWAFDLGALNWWETGEDVDMSWVGWSKESASPSQLETHDKTHRSRQCPT